MYILLLFLATMYIVCFKMYFEYVCITIYTCLQFLVVCFRLIQSFIFDYVYMYKERL